MEKFKFLFLFLLIFCRLNKLDAGDLTRRAAFASSFYPGDKKKLLSMVTSLLENTKKELDYNDKIFGIIVPHAGYIYSGNVASFAYNSINPSKYKTVIIIGPSHTEYFDYAALDNHKYWETPLGNVEIDKEITKALLKENKNIKFYPRPHLAEHSLEVQVPFLQTVLKNFKIVPIIIGAQTNENCKMLSDSIYNIIKNRDDILVVASSDLSHFHDDKTARELDKTLISDAKEFKAEIIIENCQKRKKYEACGGGPIGVMLYLARKFENSGIDLLKYGTSYDSSGDDSRVVGYSSFAIYKDIKEQKNTSYNVLNEEEQSIAINIARNSINEYLMSSKKEKLDLGGNFSKEYGAFVTLRKAGRLRGCIGNIIGYKPLWQTIRDMAIAASVKDTRFSPVTIEELDEISIEISVLTLPRKISNIDEFILGQHGLIVKKGMNSGVFLPEVALETGWSKIEFLEHLCRDKAHISKDAWKDKGTELLIFSTQKIKEK